MENMTNRVKYRATQGLYWERLIMIKDRATRRIIRPIDAWANIKTGEYSVKEIRCFITTEGGILMQLTEDDTADLPAGELDFDVIATYYKYQRLTYGSLTASYSATGSGDTVTQPVAKGTIKVEALSTVTPLEEADYMELRFKKYEDFYRTFTWRDENGDVIDVQNAYMQARSSTGDLVLDLRWTVPPPSEVVIGTYDGERRGYITENSDNSITIHVSNLNTIPTGVHRYDLFVQDNNGDWTCLVSGTMIVEASISVMP